MPFTVAAISEDKGREREEAGGRRREGVRRQAEKHSSTISTISSRSS